MADDAHWEVREAAGGLLGALLDRDFDRIRRHAEGLRSSRSANLRRAVILAAKYAARRDRPERVGAAACSVTALRRRTTASPKH